MPRIWFEQNETFAWSRSMSETMLSYSAFSSTRSSPPTRSRASFFRSFRRCQHRMKELKDLGLVSSFSVGRGFGEGRPPACWFLTKAGPCRDRRRQGRPRLGPSLGPRPQLPVEPAPRPPPRGERVLLRPRRGLQGPRGALPCHLAARALGPDPSRRGQARRVRAVPASRRCVRVLPRVRPGHGGVRRALQEARGLPAARGGMDEGAGAHRVSEPPHHRSGGGARGGGRIRPSPRDREPARRRLARHLVPAVRGERGAARPSSACSVPHGSTCRPTATASRSSTCRPSPATSSSPLDASVATSPTPMPATVVGSPPSRPRPDSAPCRPDMLLDAAARRRAKDRA